MKEPKRKIFSYQIDISEIPHNKKTIKYAFGGKAEIDEDYSDKEDYHAKDILRCLFQDAIVNCIESKMKVIRDNKLEQDDISMKRQLDYLDEKIKQYKEIQKSLKLIKK